MNPRLQALILQALVVLVCAGAVKMFRWGADYATGRRMTAFCRSHGFDGAELSRREWYCWVTHLPYGEGLLGEPVTKESIGVNIAADFEVEAWGARAEREHLEQPSSLTVAEPQA